MNWFSTHGAKVLSFATGVSALITAQADALHVPEHMVAWFTLASAVATMAHTIFFPNEGASK